MNLERYWYTNCPNPLSFLDKNTINNYKVYNKFIWELDNNSQILEIWPWNWSFSLYLKHEFNLNSDNIYTIDKSKSVIECLNKSKLTSKFNNYLIDSKEYLIKNTIKFDLIVMKHVLEHMSKDYIVELIPLLTNSLSKNGKILIEVPNIANYPFWNYMYWWDFSHLTAFTDKSITEAFLWHADNIKIKVSNIILYPINYNNLFTILFSYIIRLLYSTYIFWTLFFLKLIKHPIKVFSASVICIVEIIN